MTTPVEIGVLTDLRGCCIRVIHDPANVAQALAPGDPVTSIIDPDSVAKACRFLLALRTQGAAFDWELQVRHAAKTEPLHFAGHRTPDHLVIVGGPSRLALVELYERLAPPAADLSGPVPTMADACSGAEAVPLHLYDELARLNSESVNLQRDLARKNAHLERLVGALEAATREKDALLAKVAHDLRGPLSPIVTWARLLRQDASRVDLGRLADVLERNARSLGMLIEDLLDFARLTTGKVRVTRSSVDLRDVLRTARERVEASARAKGVTLSVDLPDEPVVVFADPERLGQVFWNLLSNAIKCTPSGGRVDVAADTEPSLVRVRIADTGCGIDASLIPSVFEPFRQGPGRGGGLGLGLAITRELVLQHEGTVTVASAGVNQGAIFTVTLPLRSAERPRGGPQDGKDVADVPVTNV